MFSSSRSRADVLALFRSRDYRLYSVQNLAAALVERSQGVAIGWYLYERTGSALVLGASLSLRRTPESRGSRAGSRRSPG